MKTHILELIEFCRTLTGYSQLNIFPFISQGITGCNFELSIKVNGMFYSDCY
jgi:hypothetical protein